MKREVLNLSCIMCKTPYEIKAREEDVVKWKNGSLIQDVLWYLNADEREMLMSGICAGCWSKYFGDEE